MRPPVLLAALLTTAVVAPAVVPPVAADQSSLDDADVGTEMLRGRGDVFATLDNPEAVREARERGRLYQSDLAVPGEIVVVRFQSERLNRSVAQDEGQNTTARFFAALNATSASARAVQLNPSPEVQALRVDLRESDVRVVRDPTTATFWLALDTSDPTLTWTDGDPAPDEDLEPGLELQFEVTPPDEAAPTYSAGVEFVAFEAADTSLTGDVTTGEPLYAQPDGSLDIRAEAPLLRGEQVTVRVRTRNGTVLDSVATTAESMEDRLWTRFDATLALDALDPEEEFVVEAFARNRTLFERRGLVGEPPTLTNQTAVRYDNKSARFTATVRYPDGGFLTVRAEDEDRPLATVYVPADDPRRVDLMANWVTIGEELYVVGWWDVNDDGQFAPAGEPPDEPWQVAGSLVETSVRVEPATPTATPTATATPPQKTPTATLPPMGTTVERTATSGPGFGLATALVAVVAVVVVARCRG